MVNETGPPGTAVGVVTRPAVVAVGVGVVVVAGGAVVGGLVVGGVVVEAGAVVCGLVVGGLDVEGAALVDVADGSGVVVGALVPAVPSASGLELPEILSSGCNWVAGVAAPALVTLSERRTPHAEAAAARPTRLRNCRRSSSRGLRVMVP